MSYMMLHGLGDCTPALHCGCLSRSPREPQPENDRQNAETLAASTLLAAAAIVAVEAEERGLRHWVDLADRLTREAALRAVPREESNDE